MRCYIRIIITSVLAVFLTLPAFGVAPSDSVKVYFRVGHRTFDPAFGHNRAVMDSFVNMVIEANAENNIDRVVVTGHASPDGSHKANERLSRLRCETVDAYVAEHTGVSRDLIHTVAGGISWAELRRMVEANPDVPMRDKVLDILDNTPVWVFDAQRKIVDGRKAQLMSLDRGVPYTWMMNHLFPELRNAVAVSIYLKPVEPEPAIVASCTEQKQLEADTVRPQTLPADSVLTERTAQTSVHEAPDANSGGEPRKRYFALKTNMLFDAALVPNVGAEVYVGKNS